MKPPDKIHVGTTTVIRLPSSELVKFNNNRWRVLKDDNRDNTWVYLQDGAAIFQVSFDPYTLSVRYTTYRKNAKSNDQN